MVSKVVTLKESDVAAHRPPGQDTQTESAHLYTSPSIPHAIKNVASILSVVFPDLLYANPIHSRLSKPIAPIFTVASGQSVNVHGTVAMALYGRLSSAGTTYYDRTCWNNST